MEIYTVTFLGHRTIHYMREVEERLDELIRKLLREKYYVDFLVGRNGEFDTMASAAIRRAKQAIGDHNSTFTLVLPYLTAEYKNSEKYFEELPQYIEQAEKVEENLAKYWEAAKTTTNPSMKKRHLTMFKNQEGKLRAIYEKGFKRQVLYRRSGG